MFERSIIEDHGFQWIIVKGRIDALSCPEIEKYLNGLILSGERFVLAEQKEKKNLNVDDLLNKFVSLRKVEKLTDEMIDRLRREYM